MNRERRDCSTADFSHGLPAPRLHLASSLFSVWTGAARWTERSKIEVVSDVNDCDLRCPPRPVSKGNSRSVSVVILLSPSCPRCPFTRPRGQRPCPELQADLQGAADLQAGHEWPFLFAGPGPEIVGKYRKSGQSAQTRNALGKKRSRLPRYIAGDDNTETEARERRRRPESRETKRGYSRNRSIPPSRLSQDFAGLSRTARAERNLREYVRNRAEGDEQIIASCFERRRRRIFLGTKCIRGCGAMYFLNRPIP